MSVKGTVYATRGSVQSRIRRTTRSLGRIVVSAVVSVVVSATVGPALGVGAGGDAPVCIEVVVEQPASPVGDAAG